MSEFEQLGTNTGGLAEIQRPAIRFVELDKGEFTILAQYLISRQFSPILGVYGSSGETRYRSLNLNGNPLGRLFSVMLEEFKLGGYESESLEFGFSEQEMEFLFRDFENQKDLVGPEILPVISPTFDSIKAKWEGAGQ